MEFASIEEVHAVMRNHPWISTSWEFERLTQNAFLRVDWGIGPALAVVPSPHLSFALVDTAWNCPGVPVIGLPRLLEARAHLALAELRIAVMRHPFEELHPLEATIAREFCAREFDLVLHAPRTGARRPATPKPGDRIIEVGTSRRRARRPAAPVHRDEHLAAGVRTGRRDRARTRLKHRASLARRHGRRAGAGRGAYRAKGPRRTLASMLALLP